MINRRTFAFGATAVPASLLLPAVSLAQSTSDTPDFDVAGSAQTDPPGWEIAWADGWNTVDVETLMFDPVPGQTGYLVLDSDERELGDQVKFIMSQRLVFESTLVNGPVHPEELMNSFEDAHPSTHMGYAPGTVIESRHITDSGCWFSFGPGPLGGGIEGVIGLSLYYTPTGSNSTLLNLAFNIAQGSFRTEEFLEEMDASVSINGDWLLNMDELGNFWDAITSSYGWYD